MTPPAPAPAPIDGPAAVGWPWPRVVVGLLARTVLMMVVGLALCGAAPRLAGWTPSTVMSGSMTPRLLVGDVAVARPVTSASLRIGQILLVHDPDKLHAMRLHRLVGMQDGRLVTRGDANPAPDTSTVATSAVIGVALLRVPWVGWPRVWAGEGDWLKVLATVAGLVGLLAVSRLGQGVPPGGGTPSTPRPARPHRLPVRWVPARPALSRLLHRVGPPSLGTLLLVGTLVTVLALAAGDAGWAAFSRKTSNPASSFGSAIYYRCSTAVLADSPYLFWKLDDASGATTAADASGNAHPGTYTSGVTKQQTGGCASDNLAGGKGASFNGSSGSITQADTGTQLQTYSLETWFKTSGSGPLISFRATLGLSSNRILYVNTAGKLTSGVGAVTVTSVTTPLAYNDNAWHLVIVTRTSATMIIYVDGVQVASGNGGGALDLLTDAWQAGIASFPATAPAAPGGYYSGSLDDVAIYNTALTSTQVATHYAARSTA